MDTNGKEDDISTPSPEDLKTFSDIIIWMKALVPRSDANWDRVHLRNCRLFAEILHKIDSNFFPISFVEKIQDYPSTSNWRVKGNSFRKLLRTVMEYYDDDVHRDMSNSYWRIDDMEFAEGDLDSMNRFMFLIVGAAFLGSNGHAFVQQVTQLDTDVQEAIKNAISSVVEYGINTSKEQDHTDISEPSEVSYTNGANGDSSHLDERAEQLWFDNERLQKEVAQLTQDRERMEKELAGARSQLMDVTSKENIQDIERELRDVREKKIKLEEQLYDAETERDALRSQMDVLTDEKLQLEATANSVSKYIDDYQRLKDENDFLRVCEVENTKLVATIEQLKQKVKDSNGLASENKVLREKLDSYLETAVQCDDLKQKNDVLRRQMTSYKIEMDTKEREARELTLKVDKLDYELAQTQERVNQLEGENKGLKAEKSALEEEKELTRNAPLHMQLAESNSLQESLMLAKSEENGNGNGTPAEAAVNFAERMSHLVIENKRLKEKAKDADELELVRHEVESLKKKNHDLVAEVRLVNKENLELKTKLDSVFESIESGTSGADKDAAALRVAAEKANIATEQWKEKALKAESQLAALQDQDSNSQSKLEKENSNLKEELAMETKRSNDYMEKAKQIIQDMEARAEGFAEGGLSRHEFDSLRREIEQKDKRIRYLESMHERANNMHEQEQRLITTAFYKMTQDVTMYQRAADAQSDSSREKSFLVKQKQSSVTNFSTLLLIVVTVLIGIMSVIAYDIRLPISVANLVDDTHLH